MRRLATKHYSGTTASCRSAETGSLWLVTTPLECFAAIDDIVAAGSTERVEAGQPFAWNPSVAGAKCEDTVLVTEHYRASDRDSEVADERSVDEDPRGVRMSLRSRPMITKTVTYLVPGRVHDSLGGVFDQRGALFVAIAARLAARARGEQRTAWAGAAFGALAAVLVMSSVGEVIWPEIPSAVQKLEIAVLLAPSSSMTPLELRIGESIAEGLSRARA